NAQYFPTQVIGISGGTERIVLFKSLPLIERCIAVQHIRLAGLVEGRGIVPRRKIKQTLFIKGDRAAGVTTDISPGVKLQYHRFIGERIPFKCESRQPVYRSVRRTVKSVYIIISFK